MAVDLMALNPVWLMPQNQANSIEQERNISTNTNNGAAKLGSDFGQFLNEALNNVNDLQKTAEIASVGLATGEVQDLHTVVIALEKAGLSLSLAVEVRNKAIDAYHEMMRMQI